MKRVERSSGERTKRKEKEAKESLDKTLMLSVQNVDGKESILTKLEKKKVWSDGEMPKDKFKWRNLKEEKTEALRRLELREAQNQAYANRFSTKRAIIPKSIPKRKEKYLKRMFKKALILSLKLQEKKVRE